MFRRHEFVQNFFALKEHDDCSLIFFILLHSIFGEDKCHYPLCELFEPFVLAIDDLDLHLIDDFALLDDIDVLGIICELKPVLSLLDLIH